MWYIVIKNFLAGPYVKILGKPFLLKEFIHEYAREREYDAKMETYNQVQEMKIKNEEKELILSEIHPENKKRKETRKL